MREAVRAATGESRERRRVRDGERAVGSAAARLRARAQDGLRRRVRAPRPGGRRAHLARGVRARAHGARRAASAELLGQVPLASGHCALEDLEEGAGRRAEDRLRPLPLRQEVRRQTLPLLGLREERRQEEEKEEEEESRCAALRTAFLQILRYSQDLILLYILYVTYNLVSLFCPSSVSHLHQTHSCISVILAFTL